MNHLSELQKLFSLILDISESYAAVADAEPNWKDGYLVITVQEGGRNLYRKPLKLNEGQNAKARLIRHELERMIAECELPILGMEVAA